MGQEHKTPYKLGRADVQTSTMRDDVTYVQATLAYYYTVVHNSDNKADLHE